MYFKQDLFNIDDNLLKRNKNIFESVKKNLFEKIQKEEFGFVNNLKNNNLKVLKKVSKELLKFDNILFLGTGGSSLGGKTLASMKKEFVLKIKNPKIFFIENIDEQPINDLLKTINLSKTAVVVISKSGETLETLAQYYLILNEMKKNKISVEGKYYILTENKNSTLKQIQENEKFYFIEHDKNIGGRYSVFSIVGLLPAKLSGVNVEILCDEAITFLDSIFSKKNNIFDDLFKPVFSQFLLMKEGFNINVFMPYIDSFHNLSYWLRQLWAESVGKNGNGTTLVNALGTVDQHSQLQLYLDGPRDKFFTIIGNLKTEKNYNYLNCPISKNYNFDILDGKSLDQLMNAEIQATIRIIKKNKLPLRTLYINDLHERTIAQLIIFFFIETIVFCYLEKVNPFDQPAVEEGKVLTKKLLKDEQN